MTEKLWLKQDQHKGDRWRLFKAVSRVLSADRVFYPGCFVDIAPSFVFPDVTYLDADKRTPRFFKDRDGVLEIIAQHPGSPADPKVRFIHGDYTKEQDLPGDHFDLLVSLYAEFISVHCTAPLNIGSTPLVNPIHGDVAMASIDPRDEVSGVVISRGEDYKVWCSELDKYLLPKKPVAITKETLHQSCRGIAYTKPAFAYLFRRTM